ncbi:XRE family transcriptional regulator [Neisseria elongata]|uniref:XRE family transcriptional regulator n=1 Tax=Neisseria elongata TaxID=495 RepID=UPI000D3AFE11|nr:helix-turn-helix transcriptional regulator [Neisseria elongata]
MSTFKDRLALLWPEKSTSEIADKIGMSYVGLSKVFSKDALPKADTLLKIHEVSGCDLKWLMTGEGVPFPEKVAISSNQELLESVGHNAKWITQSATTALEVLDTLGNPVDLSEFVFIPRYNVKVAAGHGYAVEDEKPRFTMAFRKYWIRFYLRTDPKSLSVVKVTGDSMEGVLFDGDNVLVDHSRNQPGNGLYVLRIGEELIVKRTQTLPGNHLLVSSANEAYQPFELNLADETSGVEIIGKVVWFGRQI